MELENQFVKIDRINTPDYFQNPDVTTRKEDIFIISTIPY